MATESVVLLTGLTGYIAKHTALALLAAGDMPGACEVLRVARGRLEERSARIKPDAARVRFLYDIPEQIGRAHV